MEYDQPIVDLASICNKASSHPPNEQDWISFGSHLRNAFENFGYCYLVNHGVPEKHIDEVMQSSQKFFNLPNTVKEKYAKDKTYYGYHKLGNQMIPYSCKIPELREMWDVPGTIESTLTPPYPDEVPEFQSSIANLTICYRELLTNLLRGLAIALNLEDWDCLLNLHQNLVKDEMFSKSVFRCLFYPPLPEDYIVPPNGIRCREHTDFGTITLIYQDSMGGLEIKHKDGNWYPVVPIKGSILLIGCNLLERLSGGVFTAVLHRVPVPNDDKKKNTARQSITYFLAPDDDALIQAVVPRNEIKADFDPVLTHAYYDAQIGSKE